MLQVSETFRCCDLAGQCSQLAATRSLCRSIQPNKHGSWLRALQQDTQAPDKKGQSLQKPLVVLIGWLGAKEQHFNKYPTCSSSSAAQSFMVKLLTGVSGRCRYVKMWQHMGHTTFGFRPPTPSIVLPPIGSARAAEFMKNVQSFQSLHAHQPVIYHIFRYATS